ncbi:inhibitor of cysteine peptidase [Strigomonas culicis]|uniref:Inhibitor of cysteine peptidase n=1 Tax=Strigomonas culicis TaxID=28005 RepID=S9UNC7_9TRYP|nr:inhibitor of cysteine peptidase [Strigomonas culicis]EPY32795.1 inhibitor of cysteine peptidase [Strigomonas culicis]|eukprot:EPY30438.1 inhibitor of cysteine peptidase [Strigomonas culicis]
MYTTADNNTTITAKVNAQLRIMLEGNPSTGYSWQRDKFVGKDTQSDATFTVTSTYAQSTKGLIGAPGEYTFQVVPLKAGTHTLTLVYARSFEGVKSSDEKFVLHITAE